MLQTKLERLILYIIQQVKKNTEYPLNFFSIQILYLLIGFFIATALSTIPGQTGDWGIVAGAIVVSGYETISCLIYSNKVHKLRCNSIMYTVNGIKIGTMYGLFVDTFKLGS